MICHRGQVATVFALCCAGMVLAQQAVSPDAERMEAKRLRKQKQPSRFDKPAEAQVFHASKRAPLGTRAVPTARYADALRQSDSMPRYSTLRSRALPSRQQVRLNRAPEPEPDAWTWLGPGNIGGRTRALVVHPTDPDIIFAAGVAGGIWRSSNGGADWQPIGDSMANLAVCALVLDQANPDTLYAGTGEGFHNGDYVRGAGIFKTTDGGKHWEHLAATADPDFHYVNDLVISQHESNLLCAATRSGVWLTADGGERWTKVLACTEPGGALDLEIRPDRAPEHILASCGFGPAKVYRSTEGGKPGTWTEVLGDTALGRTSLAIASSNPNIMYALAASAQSGNYYNGLHAVYRSTDGGATWQPRARNSDSRKLNTLLLSNAIFTMCYSDEGYYNQGWYDNVIAVDPIDPDVVWAGGVDLYRSDDGGMNWNLASYWWAQQPYVQQPSDSYCHADQHAIAFAPGYDGDGNQTMLVGNDGGVWVTHNARSGQVSSDPCRTPGGNRAVKWESLSHGYGVTQFYHGLPFADGTAYFGGCQDNGTLRGGDGLGPDGWAMIIGGDGGYVAVEPRNPNVMYAENYGLSIKKSTNGGGSFAPAVNGITDTSANFLFIVPFTMDPNDPHTLWTGGSVLWRTRNGAAHWTAASNHGLNERPFSAIAVSPRDSNRVLAGTADGYIFRGDRALSSDASTAWAVNRPVQGYISSLCFDPVTPTVAYATCSTFGQAHVLKTSNGGVTWDVFDGKGDETIPDVPAHTLTVEPQRPNWLYLGTDIGIFVSTNAGATWAVEHNNFINVVTEHLEIEPRSRNLFAFTHGRGVYRAALDSSVPPPGAVSRDRYTPDVSLLPTAPPRGPIQNETLTPFDPDRGFQKQSTTARPESAVTILGPAPVAAPPRGDGIAVIDTTPQDSFTFRSGADESIEFMVTAGAATERPDLQLLYTANRDAAGFPPQTFALRFDASWFAIGVRAAGKAYGNVFRLNEATRTDKDIVWSFGHHLKRGEEGAIFRRQDGQWAQTHRIRCE